MEREDFSKYVRREVGKRMRDIRDQKGWSLRKAAEVYGVSHTCVSQIESGKIIMTMETLYAVCSGLGFAPEDILPPVPHSIGGEA